MILDTQFIDIFIFSYSFFQANILFVPKLILRQEILLEFRAGKMCFEGKRVVPDTRKGLVRIGRVTLNFYIFIRFYLFIIC